MDGGEQFGDRYAVTQLVAKGGMSRLFKGIDQRSGEPVAIKLLASARRERFAREAEILAGLEHPNVVRYLTHGVRGNDPYIVQEWLEGQDLGARLTREGVTPSEALSVCTSIAAALGAAHQAGLVHRDVKPENIFLVDGSTTRAKLIDFGIARPVGVPTIKVTKTGMLVGTPGYMAPEQARGARTIDPRADVFALGCVLYEALSGKLAFAGRNLLAARAKVLFTEPTDLGSLVPGCPPELLAVVAALLAKDAALRPKNGAAVVELLSAIPSFRGPRRPTAVGESRTEVRPLAIPNERLRWTFVVVVGPPSMTRADDELDGNEVDRALPRIVEIAERYAAKVDFLADGAVCLSLTGKSELSSAYQATECALDTRDAVADCAVALVGGRVDGRPDEAVGILIDRAADALERAAVEQIFAAPSGAMGVLVDPGIAIALQDSYAVRDGRKGQYVCRLPK